MSQPVDPHILVIFGASGDLAERKLLPATFRLFQGGFLPENFALLGVGRTAYSDEGFREKVAFQSKYLAGESEEMLRAFTKHLHYQKVDTYTEDADFETVKKRLQEIDGERRTNNNFIFYLSTPPSLYSSIPAALNKHGLNDRSHGWSRLVIEKPFGYDEKSARELNDFLLQHFDEDQIYRIDHYLGKETVQNLLVTRFANGIFEPLWNRNYVHSVQITAAEPEGIGSRGGYYDDSGALRDMIQNHLLQVLAHIAMEPPISGDAKAIRDEKLKLFQSLRPIKNELVDQFVIRGQYTASEVEGAPATGYRQVEDIPDDSRTETYVAMKVFIDNWRWADVPFLIRTGKFLPTKLTEIVVTFKQPPQRVFQDMDNHIDCSNRLIIQLQPNESIELHFGMKVPGEGFRVKVVDMGFSYADLTDAYVPEAYERLLLDCMKGDPTLYSRGDSVEEAWSFVDPILDRWQTHPETALYGYPAGSWGPQEANRLFEPEGGSWHNPATIRTSSQQHVLLT